MVNPAPQVTTVDQVLLVSAKLKSEAPVHKVYKATMVKLVHLASQAELVQSEIEELQVLLALLETQVSEVFVVDEELAVLEVLKAPLVTQVQTVFPADQAKMVLPVPTVLCKARSLSDTVKNELFQFAQMVPANCGTATPCFTPKVTNSSTLKISAEPVLVCDNLAPCHSCFAA